MAVHRFPPPWSVEQRALAARARHPEQLDTPPLARQRNDGVNESPPVLETGFASVLPEVETVPFPGVTVGTIRGEGEYVKAPSVGTSPIPGMKVGKIRREGEYGRAPPVCTPTLPTKPFLLIDCTDVRGGLAMVITFEMLGCGVGTLICGRGMLMRGMLTCGRGMLMRGMLTGPALAAPPDANANVPTIAK